MKQSRLAIDPDGSATMIYSDDTAELLEVLGEATVARVSNVEPVKGGGWSVTMIGDYADTTCAGIQFQWTVYPRREAALDAEVEYLNDKLFN